MKIDNQRFSKTITLKIILDKLHLLLHRASQSATAFKGNLLGVRVLLFCKLPRHYFTYHSLPATSYTYKISRKTEKVWH